MRSQKPPVIEVKKHVDLGKLPLLLELGHKHLEKGNPLGVIDANFDLLYSVPVDILRVAKVSESLLNGIEEIIFAYDKTE